MKILYGLTIICIALLALECKSERHQAPVEASHDTTQVQGITPDEKITDGNITVYSYQKEHRLEIVSIPDSIHFVYSPKNNKTFLQIAKDMNFRYMVNATYYSGYSRDASHVGWLWIYGTLYENVAEDKQLTHIVSINRLSKKISYTYYKDFKSELDKDCLEFQTGPLIVENNKLAENYINSSINGLRKAPRTMLASLDNKQMFFIISESSMDLITLGNYIMKLSVFYGKRLDVVNLDGGPSTALYSKNYSKLNYNEDAVLPFHLGIY
ncbi:MAG: phosphodiester glycosidase family protein [Bacteroidota bacterium]|nr:phosphodiester glycosidase family protein [Bacteroidota bacterium]